MKKNSEIFWISYSDLLTSLFFLMLVLFTLSFTQLQIIISDYVKFMEIKSALENLDPEYFRYDAKNKRHELNFDILYSSNSSKIPPSSKKQLLKAGRELEQAIKNASVINNNIKYLVIIEGMAAKFNTTSKSHINNQSSFINHTYNLSYNRAKEIYKFWNDNGINFDRTSVEVIIAGSGIFGSGRYTSQEEGKNKRILIQILPKTGDF